MIDAQLRPYIDKPLDRIARLLIPMGITANSVTISGFLIGLLALPLLALQHYELALTFILINRLMDGIDGAIARLKGPTDFGGYLDIVLDFIFYSAIIFGFILGKPDQANYGAFLIFSFIGTGSSFLAFAAMAAKRSLTTEMHGKKSLYYLGGLTEGAETILAFILICTNPEHFSLIATIFGTMCWLTTAGRILWARKALI